MRKRKAAREKKRYPDRSGKNISQEEQFRLLVEGAEQYAMLLLDEDNLITFWSRGAKKLFGWSSKQAEGKKGDIIFTPEDRRAGKEKKEFDTAQREGCAVDRRWHMHKGGSRVFVDGLLLALKDPDTRETRGFAKICRDASEQHEASEALRRAHAELEQRVADRTKQLAKINTALKREILRRRTLEREIIEVSERERERISQDLHDTLCQELTATAILLKSNAKNCDVGNRKCAESLEEAAQTINRNVGLARDLARNLRPFDFLPGGLITALRQLAARTNNRVPCRCDCSQKIHIRDRNISVNLYRIAQEAVNNILKHAGASHIVIGIRRSDDALLLNIRDDGVGFQPSKKGRGLGIHLMTYRADVVDGKLSIKTHPGRGTTITCNVPLRHSPGHSLVDPGSQK